MRRRQRDQADEVSVSRSRLQAAADEESRHLERQLEDSVMSRLATMRELVAGTPYAGLVARLDEVRDELLRHARGLDPLAGRTLAQALAPHVERGVTVSVDPSVIDSCRGAERRGTSPRKPSPTRPSTPPAPPSRSASGPLPEPSTWSSPTRARAEPIPRAPGW